MMKALKRLWTWSKPKPPDPKKKPVAAAKKKREGLTFGDLVWLVSAGLIVFMLLPFGWFVKDETAMKAAVGHGFSDPAVTGKSIHFVRFRGCTKDDDAAFDVAARRDGSEVDLKVCCGWPLRGCSVRLK